MNLDVYLTKRSIHRYLLSQYLKRRISYVDRQPGPSRETTHRLPHRPWSQGTQSSQKAVKYELKQRDCVISSALLNNHVGEHGRSHFAEKKQRPGGYWQLVQASSLKSMMKKYFLMTVDHATTWIVNDSSPNPTSVCSATSNRGVIDSDELNRLA